MYVSPRDVYNFLLGPITNPGTSLFLLVIKYIYAKNSEDSILCFNFGTKSLTAFAILKRVQRIRSEMEPSVN